MQGRIPARQVAKGMQQKTTCFLQQALEGLPGHPRQELVVELLEANPAALRVGDAGNDGAVPPKVQEDLVHAWALGLSWC